MTSALLAVHDLHKRFGTLAAVSEVNVEVEEHEVVGVIGANGAGKTTFVNMVTGYLAPTSGTIAFRGRDITGRLPRQILRLGIARSFQVPQVFESVSVLDNLLVAFGIAEDGALPVWKPLHRRERLERAAALLEAYGIADYGDQAATLLPQGVRKLLDIAMATVMGPELLLLDEPTSGISAAEKFDIMDTIMGVLRAQKSTVLFIEHDMEIIGRYARRVLAFANGFIIADGTPQEVIADPEVRRLVVGEPGEHAA